MSQAPGFARRLCRRQLAPERLGLHVVGADTLAVDLDDRDQLAVAGLELRVAVDRYLDQLEPQLLSKPGQLCRGPLAEMAALCPVKNDLGRLRQLEPPTY